MNADRHRLLARQMRRHFPDGQVPEGMESFLEEVNQSYHQFDANNQLLDRAMDISNSELYDRNQSLEAEMAQLDSFIYRASHDLKAPANNILSMVRLLEEQLGDSTPLQDQALAHVRNASEGLLKQLRELLELSRMKQQINEAPEYNCLHEISMEIWDCMRPQAEASNAELKLDFHRAPSLRLGKGNLRSILQNLIGNGLKYRSPERKPVVEVHSYADTKGILLEIKDNGLGMDLDKYGDKLFGMFNRFHNHVEGNGVGLYIVKQIVESSRGKIQVTSDPGKGTTFQIRFPEQKLEMPMECLTPSH